MKCPRCDREAPDDAVVCPYCATRFAEAATSIDPIADAATSIDPIAEATTSIDPMADAATSIPAAEETASIPVAEVATPVPLADAATSLAAAASGVTAPAGNVPPVARASHDGPDSATTSVPRPRASQHGRFLPGVTVAGRYRVVGLLGTGGMGEVYRADDLTLGQQVALKFLPAALADDPTHVERLLDEVRMARQVSHPNVCRVFDVGAAEGHHYVSMEYVDGEDLASLLRRIGRLPKDKAVEIGRQLCAALAAAHDEGVLHRDLKPANIMLDGRGRVKLTDFGLAAVAEVRAGTPVYMAPEQLAGEAVSIKSDLYSLGLVLHELFTGKRVFEADSFDELTHLHQDTVTSTLTITGEHDPAIDRMIQRCLERDPDKRPSSALAAAAGLPGADPLAAALAAGETPSPEMVADAGGEGTLPLAVALPLLLFALFGAIAVGLVQARESLVAWAPVDAPPAVLEARAHDVATALGYDADLADEASGFERTLAYVDWLGDKGVLSERRDTLASGRPPVIEFWWRGSPQPLSAAGIDGLASNPMVTLADPPRTTPGVVGREAGTPGERLWADVVPPSVPMFGEGEVAEGTGAAAPEAGSVEPAAPSAANGTQADWAVLFDLMGLDPAGFTVAAPRLNPPHFADQRAAWEGVHPGDPELSLRIEAAALAGRVVSVRMFPAYDPLVEDTVQPSSGLPGLSFSLVAALLVVGTFMLLLFTAIFGALYVAQRNIRSGRGDPRGARRLGFAVAVAVAIEWLLTQRSLLSFDMFDGVLQMLIFVAAAGGLTWALYLAAEPFMRRHAPSALIGWTRLIDGRIADPLVGRDVLIGCAAGILSRGLDLAPMVLDDTGETLVNYAHLPFTAPLMLVATLLGIVAQYVVFGLALSFLLGLTYVALGRRWWAAFGAWVAFLGAMAFLPGLSVSNVAPSVTILSSICWLAASTLWLFVLVRVGILAYCAAAISAWLLAISLPSMDFSAWYSGSMLTGLMLFVALAGYAFYRSIAGAGDIAGALAGD